MLNDNKTLTANQKKVILFPAGASGHFLAQFLSADLKDVNPSFRIDNNQQISSAYKFVNGNEGKNARKKMQDFDSQACLDSIINVINGNAYSGVLSHYLKISNLRSYTDRAWIRKIYPRTNIFGWIKNVHFKKQQLENVDYSDTDLLFQFDSAFALLIDWYNILLTDNDLPEDLLLDFGDLYNINYLENLYFTVNGYVPSNEKISWAKKYIDQQFGMINDSDSKDLATIIKQIAPKDIFDLAVALFVYEKNHSTIDQNRLWTIDDLPETLDAAVEFLVSNSKNYTIFKGN